jgi:phage internal scaffolding protein
MSEFKNAYSKVRSPIDLSGESPVKQSLAKQCDVNHIVSRYQKTGVIDHFNKYQGRYEDLTIGVDYHTAMNKFIEAQDAFMSLPSSVRKKFDNDPATFIAFVSDPSNIDEMYEIGLARKSDPVVATEPDPVVTEGSDPAGGE